MNSFIIFLLLATPSYAGITPTLPTPDEIFHTGEQCPIKWDVDTSWDGTWDRMRIDLMTGNDPARSLVTTVLETISGSDPSHAEYSWICPEVDFDGPVYSYKFTPAAAPESALFSPQFTITGWNGAAGVPATSETSEIPPEPSESWSGENGVAHVSNPNDTGPQANSGEELQEYVDPVLGGSDSTPTEAPDTNPPQANFLLSALAEATQTARGGKSPVDQISSEGNLRPQSVSNGASSAPSRMVSHSASSFSVNATTSTSLSLYGAAARRNNPIKVLLIAFTIVLVSLACSIF